MEDIGKYDIVKLPLNEIGIVRFIIMEQLDWFPYKVEIIRDGLFNEVGSIREFKKEELVKINIE